VIKKNFETDTKDIPSNELHVSSCTSDLVITLEKEIEPYDIPTLTLDAAINTFEIVKKNCETDTKGVPSNAFNVSSCTDDLVMTLNKEVEPYDIPIVKINAAMNTPERFKKNFETDTKGIPSNEFHVSSSTDDLITRNDQGTESFIPEKSELSINTVIIEIKHCMTDTQDIPSNACNTSVCTEDLISKKDVGINPCDIAPKVMEIAINTCNVLTNDCETDTLDIPTNFHHIALSTKDIIVTKNQHIIPYQPVTCEIGMNTTQITSKDSETDTNDIPSSILNKTISTGDLVCNIDKSTSYDFIKEISDKCVSISINNIDACTDTRDIPINCNKSLSTLDLIMQKDRIVDCNIFPPNYNIVMNIKDKHIQTICVKLQDIYCQTETIKPAFTFQSNPIVEIVSSIKKQFNLSDIIESFHNMVVEFIKKRINCLVDFEEEKINTTHSLYSIVHYSMKLLQDCYIIREHAYEQYDQTYKALCKLEDLYEMSLAVNTKYHMVKEECTCDAHKYVDERYKHMILIDNNSYTSKPYFLFSLKSFLAKFNASVKWLIKKAELNNIYPGILNDTIINTLSSAEPYIRLCYIIYNESLLFERFELNKPHQKESNLETFARICRIVNDNGIDEIDLYIKDQNWTFDIFINNISLYQDNHTIFLKCHSTLINSFMMAYSYAISPIEKICFFLSENNETFDFNQVLSIEDGLVLWIKTILRSVSLVSFKSIKLENVSTLNDLFNNFILIVFILEYYSCESFNLEPTDFENYEKLLSITQNFCDTILPKNCLFLTIQDIRYKDFIFKFNFTVFLAELFYWFEACKNDVNVNQSMNETTLNVSLTDRLLNLSGCSPIVNNAGSINKNGTLDNANLVDSLNEDNDTNAENDNVQFMESFEFDFHHIKNGQHENNHDKPISQDSAEEKSDNSMTEQIKFSSSKSEPFDNVFEKSESKHSIRVNNSLNLNLNKQEIEKLLTKNENLQISDKSVFKPTFLKLNQKEKSKTFDKSKISLTWTGGTCDLVRKVSDLSVKGKCNYTEKSNNNYKNKFDSDSLDGDFNVHTWPCNFKSSKIKNNRILSKYFDRKFEFLINFDSIDYSEISSQSDNTPMDRKMYNEKNLKIHKRKPRGEIKKKSEKMYIEPITTDILNNETVQGCSWKDFFQIFCKNQYIYRKSKNEEIKKLIEIDSELFLQRKKIEVELAKEILKVDRNELKNVNKFEKLTFSMDERYGEVKRPVSMFIEIDKNKAKELNPRLKYSSIKKKNIYSTSKQIDDAPVPKTTNYSSNDNYEKRINYTKQFDKMKIESNHNANGDIQPDSRIGTNSEMTRTDTFHIDRKIKYIDIDESVDYTPPDVNFFSQLCGGGGEVDTPTFDSDYVSRNSNQTSNARHIKRRSDVDRKSLAITKLDDDQNRRLTFNTPNSRRRNVKSVVGQQTKSGLNFQCNTINRHSKIFNDINSKLVDKTRENSDVSTQYKGLFKKSSTRSNRNIIINAIIHNVLPGGVNLKTRNLVLSAIENSDAEQFIILFGNSRLQYRAIYAVDESEDCLVKIIGLINTPQIIRENMHDKFYKFNSGSKLFSYIESNKHLSVSLDGLIIKKEYYKANKR
ncbi:hypothetical protein A3Q56_05784, partial [Intoshia linei]